MNNMMRIKMNFEKLDSHPFHILVLVYLKFVSQFIIISILIK